DDHFALCRLVKELGIHVEAVADTGKGLGQVIEAPSLFRLETDAHEEGSGFDIIELRAVGDVASLLRQKGRDRRDDPAAGFAMNAKGEASLHVVSVFLRLQFCVWPVRDRPT